MNVELREAVFRLLEDRIGGDGNRGSVGPGVSLWTIFVLGVLKRGLGCDFDRLLQRLRASARFRRCRRSSSVALTRMIPLLHRVTIANRTVDAQAPANMQFPDKHRSPKCRLPELTQS